MDISLTVHLTARDFKELLDNVSGDISMGGLFVQTRTPRPVQTEVKLELELEAEKQLIRADGIVVRSVTPEQVAPGGAPPGMAICFTGFGEGDDKVLRWLLDLHKHTDKDKDKDKDNQ